MQPLKKFRPLLIVIITGILFSSCGKSSVKPKKTTTVTTYTVTTIAGTGTAGSTDGAGMAASFNWPSCVVLNSSGDLYIGDFKNNLVRKMNLTSAAVTTVAGTGAAGFFNDGALASTFRGTANIAFDKGGNLFVSDEENNAIREITSGGNVVTIAGSGVAGFHDGTGAAAQFNQPEGLVVDGSGNIYVVDGTNHAVRKVVIVTGVVTTIAGTGVAGFADGPGSSAQFHSPYGLAMDGSGNLYVADIVNNRIRKVVVSTGVVSTFAGTGAQGLSNGTTATATFWFPAGVTFDSQGNLYVGEIRNYTVRKIAANGTVTTIAGTGTQGSTDGPAAAASFYQPIGLVVDDNGNIYVADEFNDKIRKITAVVTQQ